MRFDAFEALRTRLREEGRREGFTASVLTIAGATGAAHALALLAAPLLTRIYSPEDFGVMTVYASILSILAIPAWCYEFAIPLPRDDRIGADLVVLGVSLVVVSTLVFAIAVIVFGPQVALWLDADELVPYLWLLPLGMFGMGLYEVLKFWAIRRKAFRTIGRTKITQGAGLVITQLAVGAVSPTPLGLIIGDIVGRAGGVGSLATTFVRDARRWVAATSIGRLRAVMRTYRRFPLVVTISITVNNAGLYVPALAMAGMYGGVEAGWFGLGQRLVGVPLALIGQATAQVFYGRFSEAVREDASTLKELFLAVSRRLLLVGIPPMVVLLLAGPWLFEIAFGSRWETAGHYIRILAPMLLTQFVVAPLSQTLVILEKQEWQLAWDVSRAVLSVGPILIAGLLGLSATVAVALYGAGMLLSYVAHWLLSNYAIDRHAQTQST